MRTLMNKIRNFASDKSGAVTVDWVALTAAIVVIGIALVYAVFGADSNSGFSGLASSAASNADSIEGDTATIFTNRVVPVIGGS